METTAESMDVSGLLVVALVATLIAAIGAAIDHFMLPREKGRLSDWLLAWWVRIEEIRLPNLVATFAEYFISAKNVLLGESVRSRKWVVRTVVYSVLLTFGTLVLGDYMWAKTIDGTWEYYSGNPRFLLYPINYFFDFATVILTVWIMSQIPKVGLPLQATYLTLDIVSAVLLAFCASTISHTIEFWGEPATLFGPHGFSVWVLKAHVQNYLTYWSVLGLFDWEWEFVQGLSQWSEGWISPHPAVYPDGGNWGNSASFFSANTTLIPTAFFAALLLLILSSLFIIRVIKGGILRLIRLDIETDKTIFFYTGALIGLIAVILKTGVELAKLI